MKPAIEWGHAVEEAVAEDIQRDVLDAAADLCEQYASGASALKGSERHKGGLVAALSLASLIRQLKP